MGVKDTRALYKEERHKARAERFLAELDDQDRQACGLWTTAVAAMVRPAAGRAEIDMLLEEVLRAIHLCNLTEPFRICLANLAAGENNRELLRVLGYTVATAGAWPDDLPRLDSAEAALKATGAELVARMQDREADNAESDLDDE